MGEVIKDIDNQFSFRWFGFSEYQRRNRKPNGPYFGFYDRLDSSYVLSICFIHKIQENGLEYFDPTIGYAIRLTSENVMDENLFSTTNLPF